MLTLLLHLANSEPIKIDVDEMPKPSDSVIIGRNPRERTDKEVTWIEDGVSTVMFPWWRINYVEVLPVAEEAEEFPLPFRND